MDNPNNQNEQTGLLTETELATMFTEEPTNTNTEAAINTETKPSIENAPKKHHKALLPMVACVIIVIIGVVVGMALNNNKGEEEVDDVATKISKLTDKQKTKLGIEQVDTPIDTKTPEIEDENNYTEEYKQYLELSEDEKAKIEVVPRKEKIPDTVIEEIKEDTPAEVLVSLPDKFDLRESITITVGNQGISGNCWSFASSTALETHLKLRGIDYNPSESQVDYLASHLMYEGRRQLHYDGGSFDTYAKIASSIGTISEETFSSFGIKDAGFGEKRDRNDFSYLQLANNDNPVYITKIVDFPSVYKHQGEVSDKTEEELKEFRDLVKAHIMTNGSLYASVSTPWDRGHQVYCGEYSNDCNIGHAVAIIGWDDFYPKESFFKISPTNGDRTDEHPKHDGAYLVQTSYGEDWDGYGGEHGVYYVSYDDFSIENNLSGVVSTSINDSTKLSSIESDAIKNIIREKLQLYIIEQDGEEYITDYGLSRISYLNLSSRGLTNDDFSAIAEFFPRVTSIDISDNEISDLSPIKNYQKLYDFEFSNNKVEDILAICSMEELPWLDMSYNNIKDISCLEGKIDEYGSLNISGNVGVKGLEKFTTLSSLKINDMELESLDLISNLKKLTSIEAKNNNIKNLDGLNSEEETIGYINLSGNEALKSLASSKAIDTIFIEDSGLTDASILNSTSAKRIYAKNNNFGDLSGFNNDSIEVLDLSNNKNLSNISSVGTVKNLLLSNCNITSFAELGTLNKIEVLDLNNNKINSLDGIDNFTNIVSIDLDNNQLSSLEGISKLTKLSVFSADNNNIQNADELADIGSLTYISLNNNHLSSIPTFETQQELSLALEGNAIENIVIPQNVWGINLNNCNLKTIDYSSAKSLYIANLKGNPKWNEYGDMIEKVIALRKSETNQNPYFSITTDYNFTDDDFDKISSIPGLTNRRSNWSLNLTDRSYELTKDLDGIVYLENYPQLRSFFMAWIGSGSSSEDFIINKEASKLTLRDDSVDTIRLDVYMTTDEKHIHITDDVIFNLE